MYSRSCYPKSLSHSIPSQVGDAGVSYYKIILADFPIVKEGHHSVSEDFYGEVESLATSR